MNRLIGIFAAMLIASLNAKADNPPLASWGQIKEASKAKASGKANTDCSLMDIMAGTCSDTESPVSDEVPPADPFNIQIEYQHVSGPPLSADAKAVIERAARRWEAVIVEGFPDFTFSYYSALPDAYKPYDGVFIDDFALTVNAKDLIKNKPWRLGSASSFYGYGYRDREIPLMGTINLFLYTEDSYSDDLQNMYGVALHEIGHALGIKSTRRNSERRIDYWTKPAFVAQFGLSDLWGWSHDGHFNLGGDVMSAWTPIWYLDDVTTLSATFLDDLGYHVDYDAVEDFVIPSASAKLSILAEHNLFCGVPH